MKVQPSKSKSWMLLEVLCLVILLFGTAVTIVDILKMLGIVKKTCSISLTRMTITQKAGSDRTRNVQIEDETVQILSNGGAIWPPTYNHVPDRPLWTLLMDGKTVKADASFEKMKTLFKDIWENYGAKAKALSTNTSKDNVIIEQLNVQDRFHGV